MPNSLIGQHATYQSVNTGDRSRRTGRYLGLKITNCQTESRKFLCEFRKEKGGGWGALELGLRYSNFDGSDFRSTNPAGTGTLPATSASKADAYTAQIKWLPNPYTRFLINYVHTSFDTPVTVNTVTTDSEKAITLRGQLDF